MLKKLLRAAIRKSHRLQFAVADALQARKQERWEQNWKCNYFAAGGTIRTSPKKQCWED